MWMGGGGGVKEEERLTVYAQSDLMCWLYWDSIAKRERSLKKKKSLGDRQTDKVKLETQKLNFLIPTERSHILSTPLNTNPTSCTHTDTPPLPPRNLHWPVTSASPWQLMLFSLLASDLLRSFSRFFCSIFCLKNKFKKRCDPAHVKVNTQ